MFPPPVDGEDFTSYKQKHLDAFAGESCELILPVCIRPEHTELSERLI